MRNTIFVCLLMILLAGCQSTSVEQDPMGVTLPLGTISTLNMAFHKQSLPYVRSVSIWRFEEIPDIVGINATGAYIPFTKTILLGDNATYLDRTLVHEMLHVIFFNEEYPFPELFERDLERFLKDKQYEKLVASVEKSLEDYKDSPRFPAAFMDDEYYAYIGERLYAQNRGGELGLPDYMARHYRGVLNPLFYFDHRYYKDMIHPKVDRIRARFTREGRTFVVTDSLVKIRALVRHGGIVRKKDTSSITDLVVGSVGAGEDAAIGEYQLAPGTIPEEVMVQIDAASYKYRSSLRSSYWGFEVWDENEFQFRLGEISLYQMLQNTIFLALSWKDSERLFDLYLQKRLEVRVTPYYSVR